MKRTAEPSPRVCGYACTNAAIRVCVLWLLVSGSMDCARWKRCRLVFELSTSRRRARYLEGLMPRALQTKCTIVWNKGKAFEWGPSHQLLFLTLFVTLHLRRYVCILVSCYTRIMSSLPAADTVTSHAHVRKTLEPTAFGLNQTETVGRYCVVWHQPDQ